MLRGLLKDMKVYDFSKSTGKGKKTNLIFSDNSDLRKKKAESDADKIFSSSGTTINGKLSKKFENRTVKTPEISYSPSKKVFPIKMKNTKRTIYPNLQTKPKEKSCSKIIKSESKNSVILNQYKINKNPELSSSKSGIKIVNSNNYSTNFDLTNSKSTLNQTTFGRKYYFNLD